MAERRGISDPVLRFHAEYAENNIDQTASGLHELEDDTAHDDDGDEVRRVGNHLNRLAISVGGDIIQKQRQNHGHGEQRQLIKADGQCVPDIGSRKRAIEEFLEILEPDPFAIGNALGNLEISEGNLDSFRTWVCI